MSFAILTDSCCNFYEDAVRRMDLHVLPLTFILDGETWKSYEEGRIFDYQRFYASLRNGANIKTSLPNLAESEQTVRDILDTGCDLLYIGFSSGLSGTFESTNLLMRNLASEYPNQTLLACDTLAASLGQGLLVHYAAKMRDSGKSIRETYDWLEDNKLKLAHWFVVGDLEYLSRSGRLSKGAAKIGTMLNIKPVLHQDDEGHLVPVEVVRGRKRSLNALVEHMEKSADSPIGKQTIFITHADCLNEAQHIARRIKERLGGNVSMINYVDPVIGAHCGPDTIALFFLADKR